MPAFGSRKTAPPPSEPSVPQSAEPSAVEQLTALLSERGDIERELAGHRDQREKWLTDGGPLDRIVQLGSDDDRLKLRAEQLAALLPAAQRAVRREQVAQRDARWQELAPELDQAQQDTAAAIRAYNEASTRFRDLHWQVTQAGYDHELREQFVTPPHATHNPWVFHSFLTAVEQCRQRRATVQAMATAPVVAFNIDDLFTAPYAERFVPKRVDPREVEAISPLAPPVAIHVLHGPLRTSGLNFGIATMRVGEQHRVPARAAHILVSSGCAERVDEAVPATAA